MAAAVPVTDVLCEAMEYLSKLGSNLRSRSENLKEKRIRKDKLKNSHAIQKAAQKVLLICELSKKSLDNVEVGVRKILSHVKASQEMSYGGKVDSSHKPEESHLQYFEYNNYKLTASKNIPIKHFLCVKVLVKAMSMSTLDNYPVYYQCKLHKLRKQNVEEHQNEKSLNQSDNSITINKDVLKTNVAKVHSCDNMSDVDTVKKHKDLSNTESVLDQVTGIEDTLTQLNSEDTNFKNKVQGNDDKIKRVSKESETSPIAIVENVEVITDSSKSKDYYSKLDNIKLDDTTTTQSKHSSEIRKKPNSNEKDSSCEKLRRNSGKKKFKHIKVFDDSSDSDESKSKKDESVEEISNEKHIESNKKLINDNKDSHTQLKNDCNKEIIDKNNDSDATKPIIKCVSMSKLLKPEVLSSNIDIKVSSIKKIGSKESVEDTSIKETEMLKHNRKDSTTSRKKSEVRIDEEYWREKRKEVSSFKAKPFIVRVVKLTKYSKTFLVINNIKRITQGGELVYQLQEHSDPDSKALNKVKSDLLHDSDSSQEPVSEKEIYQAKNALLGETDSDEEESQKSSNKVCGPRIFTPRSKDRNKGNEEEDLIKAKKAKKSLIENSDSENYMSCDSNNPKETVQESYLAGSSIEDKPDETSEKFQEEKMSDDNDPMQTGNKNKDTEKAKQTSDIGSSQNSDSSSSGSKEKSRKHKKGKHALDSKRAKNMLLRYSSSTDNDENDGEKLRKTIEEIKDNLLKDNEMEKNRLRRKHSNSSSLSSNKDDNRDRLRSGSTTKKVSRSSKESGDDSQNTEVCSNASSSKMVRSKALPSSSSGHNSDSQDTNDKDIDGLTNLNSLNKVRRRRVTSQDSEQTSSTNKGGSMAKTSPLNLGSGDVLAVDTSSDEASANEDVEDIPPVENLNGDSIGHNAKDDLLGESDSSVSHNEKDKTGDESDDGNVKSKRRKANTISSDSEVGSSRRREGNKESDFEDSEDDISESTKRSKRKKKGSDSDASCSASSTDGGKKKRRRIKQIDSDVSGSDTENEGRNKHGRKNIRKVMGKNQLEEATKKAAREEKERMARIAERQKLYNNMEFDESGKPDEVVLEKVVLDFDPETKEPLIEVDRGLVKKLKPHQANGIKFMWDACFESVKRIKKDRGSGCILAHCMGLGKTLQVVSLTHTLLTHGDLTGVNRVLVVCPLSTVLNWVNEFRMWLKHAETEYDVDVYELSRYKQNSERAFQLQQWTQGGGVCVLGYEMFRNLSADNPKKFKKKMLKSFQEALVDPGPDLVVCDEGHLLKNEKTSLSQSMNRVKTRRRIVLTGTPLQNNLKEYYCMVQFVKPNLLGKYNEYLNRFVNPITNGQYTDSTEHDIRVMKRRSHVLHKMLDGAVQRRDYGVLAPFLPPKHEYVIFITLTEIQIKLYQEYLENYSRRPQPGKSSGFLFPDFQSLQRIWTHPLVLKYNSERYEIMQQKKRDKEEEDSEGSLADFIDDDSTPEESTTEDSTDDSSEMSDDSRKKSKKKKAGKKGKTNNKAGSRRGTRANPIELVEEPKEENDVEEVRNENPTEWWIKLVEEDELEDMRNSHKLLLLFDILRQCETIGDKLLVFSQSLYSLDLIEHFLGKVDEATQDGRIDEKLGNHVGSWSPGVDYFRLDGSTSCENRSIWCKNFNREDNPRARLFLISTRAGGLGINLVAANRVVIFDVSWNPSHDVQSIFRVYRFGQKKPCYVYRFLAMGTMEEKIYERQVTKQAISKRVIDEQQIDRHYAENDLAELYKFEPHPPTPRPLPPLPKDRLFAEMLREHEAQIYKYHEHDSLLENKEEETLTEEERKAAWEDFENEKNKPPPAPFPTAWPMHNGMFPNIMQQQMAYAALASMLRKDMPNLNESQIRDMLPVLYNTNQGLMQKLNDMYKYTQSGMMNPMLNAMNAVGNEGGMGGSSGLHYEPPWQRQQQQQQHQIHLQQQMMQHQNQMGAKFYAGGLGSRDPMAIRMQQQRAREIMMDPVAGRRPRGRPPMQPRVPPIAHDPHAALAARLPPATHIAPADIVNLDSD